jgi:hypothetical protein
VAFLALSSAAMDNPRAYASEASKPTVGMRHVSRKPARASRALDGGVQPIIGLPTPSSVTGGNNTSSGVTVAGLGVPAGYYCIIGCTNPSVLKSPTNSWPFNLNFATGSTYQGFTLGTNSVSQSTTVTIYTCPAGLDPSNSANWSSSTTITVTP